MTYCLNFVNSEINNELGMSNSIVKLSNPDIAYFKIHM